MIEQRRLRHRLSAIELDISRIQRERAALDQQYCVLQAVRLEVVNQLNELEQGEKFNDQLDS